MVKRVWVLLDDCTLKKTLASDDLMRFPNSSLLIIIWVLILLIKNVFFVEGLNYDEEEDEDEEGDDSVFTSDEKQNQESAKPTASADGVSEQGHLWA